MQPFGFPTNWESNWQPFRFHVPFWIPSIERIIRVRYQEPNLLHKRRGDGSITKTTRTVRYREKQVSVNSLIFWSGGSSDLDREANIIRSRQNFIVLFLRCWGSHPMVQSSITILYCFQLSTLFLWVCFMLSALRSEVNCWWLSSSDCNLIN